MALPAPYRPDLGDLGAPDDEPLSGPRAALAVVDNIRSAADLGWSVTPRGVAERYPAGPASPRLAQDLAIFQRDRGMPVDGVLDRTTLDALRAELRQWQAAGRPADRAGRWIARYLALPAAPDDRGGGGGAGAGGGKKADKGGGWKTPVMIAGGVGLGIGLLLAFRKRKKP